MALYQISDLAGNAVNDCFAGGTPHGEMVTVKV